MEDLKLTGERIESNTFTFNTSENTPIIELRNNGDIFVRGKLTENDKEVVNAMREFLNLEDLFCKCENNSDIYLGTKTYHEGCNKEVKSIRIK